MLIHLKIKIKSLSQEVRIIKAAEQKLRGPHWGPSYQRSSLRQHRIHDIRPEIRDSHIAYGYLRGRKLEQIESASTSEPNWENAKRMVKKYGTSKQWEGFDSWRTGKQSIAA